MLYESGFVVVLNSPNKLYSFCDGSELSRATLRKELAAPMDRLAGAG